MTKFSLRRLASSAWLDVCLLLLLLTAATPVIVFRHQSLFIAPQLDLLDHSWLLDTSYKAASGTWFGRDVAFTYGPLFQWLSSAPARWLGVSTGTIFATWYTLPLFVVILATFVSGRLLFPPEEPWRRALFLLLAVVVWSVPDVRPSVALLAFLIFLRFAHAVATGRQVGALAGIVAAIICIGCFLLSADTGTYSLAALLISVVATGAVMWHAPRARLWLTSFVSTAAVCFAVLVIVTNAMMFSALNFTYWRSSLAIIAGYRWFEALGMPRASKHMLFVVLAATIILFALGWIWREPHSRRWTLRPAFLVAGFCFSLVMMQSGIARSDPGHVLLAIFPMVFLGGAILIGGRSNGPIISAIGLVAAVVLTVVLGHAYWVFRPYSVEVKAQQIARPVLSCPAGYRLFDRACLQDSDAGLLLQVSNYVDQHTTAANSIVVFPYETAVGLTSRRQVAGGLLQSYLANGEYLTELELGALSRANPSLGLYFPDGVISKTIDDVPNFTRSPELWFYLLRHYRSTETPAAGVVALAPDENRDWRMRISAQRIAEPDAWLPISKRNTWLDLGSIHWPQDDLDFLRLRLQIGYSPLWRLRKPSRLALQMTFADGSQKLNRIPRRTKPNH